MANLRVTHFFGKFRGLGGVQTFLQQHYEKDQAWGMDSSFIIYHEAETERQARVHFLGLQEHHSIRQARQKIRQAIAAAPPQLAIYHDLWGMPFWSDLDQASRRVFVLHGKYQGVERWLQSRRMWLDGVVCVSEETVNLAQRWLPSLAADRIRLLPVPLSSCPVEGVRPRPANRPFLLGYSGRLIREHKRVDRFPELCRRLDEARIDFRFEILGDGPERPWLESRLGNRPHVQFHGRLSGEDYWRALSRWDAILFVSDTEGLPVSLIEALASGVIPIYPRIRSGGDSYVKRVAEELLFEPGNLAQLSQTVARLAGATSEQIENWRARCRVAAAPHLKDAYLRQFSEFLNFLLDAHRASQKAFPWARHLVGGCSFATLKRISVWRRGFLKRWGGRQRIEAPYPLDRL
jgi:glycosyltransferase involved in cell wall biosynthesis